MNSTTTSASTPAADVPLTRAAKEKLLLQMYSRKHWIELIRLFRYQTLPMEQARKAIEPLAKEFGKEPMAAACEVLIEIFTPGKETVARLKPHVRRMAYQMLGPEPAADAVPATVARPPADPQPVATTPQLRETKKGRKRATPKPASPAPPSSNPASRDCTGTVMEQYRAAKEKHPGMLLLFRVGDFLEMFGEDAETAHKLLGLTLTTRDRTLPMAGFPHHQLEVYLRKLLHEGQRVAICEPVEESLAHGPIRREVTRVVTPNNLTGDDRSAPVDAGETVESPKDPGRLVKQPRSFVLKRCETWLKDAGLTFASMDEVRRSTPAVAPYVGVLDFIVQRGDEKLLVAVRPHLQAKHRAAFCDLHKLYGSEYMPVRVWPNDGSDGWTWQVYPLDLTTTPR